MTGFERITNETLKYEEEALIQERKNLTVNQKNVPKEWKTSLAIRIFNKGVKIDPDNYSGIILLNSSSQAFTKYILQDLNNRRAIREEQHGFGKTGFSTYFQHDNKTK